MKEILELKDISAGYEQTTVLQGVNLTIRENDFVGIIGPNGGGENDFVKGYIRVDKAFLREEHLSHVQAIIVRVFASKQ